MDLKTLRLRLDSFPEEYWRNFDHVWMWKAEVESRQGNSILDNDHRQEAYRRLCLILPRWQTYRNGENPYPLGTLREALANMSEAYDQLRKCTLIDFDRVPRGALEIVWSELGRVKERDGDRNEGGLYSIIAVCKPLLLTWGQTPAFDSKVRGNLNGRYGVPKYAGKCCISEWLSAMEGLSADLKMNRELVEAIERDAARRYGFNAVVPYGRYPDIYYWEGP